MTAKILSTSSLAISIVLWGMVSYYTYQILRVVQEKRKLRYEEEKKKHTLRRMRFRAWLWNFSKDWFLFLLKGFVFVQFLGLLVAAFGYVYAAPWLTPEVFEALPDSEHVVATITWCAIPVVCAAVLLLVRSRARRGEPRKPRSRKAQPLQTSATT